MIPTVVSVPRWSARLEDRMPAPTGRRGCEMQHKLISTYVYCCVRVWIKAYMLPTALSAANDRMENRVSAVLCIVLSSTDRSQLTAGRRPIYMQHARTQSPKSVPALVQPYHRSYDVNANIVRRDSTRREDNAGTSE